MRVFVAGGSGVIGRRLIPQLVANGHQVTASVTSPAKAGVVETLGATPSVMDGLDAASVGEAVAAAEPDALVHQMTAIAGTPDYRHLDRWFATTNRLRTEGTDNLLAAADAAGVEHVVAQSYGAWNGLREGGWVKTEDDPLDRHEGTPAAANSAALQHLESAVLGAGGAVTRFGGFYGADAGDDMLAAVRKRQLPLVGNGEGRTSWVHVEDAAAATVLVLEQRARGLFDIADDEPAPANEWVPYLAECLGAKKPMHVPTWLARLFAGPVAVIMMVEGRGFANDKAKRELGWRLRYPSWRQGFRDGWV